MANSKPFHNNKIAEVDLGEFIKKILSHWYLFLISVGICVAAGYVYVKWAAPIFQVSTTLLIDTFGTRNLGENQYVEGGVGLIGTEKNIFNEIGIIKSHSLIKQTLEELDFQVTYYKGTQFKTREIYEAFPLTIELNDAHPQLFDTPFDVEILADGKFKISIEAESFYISDPAKDYIFEVEEELSFSKIYEFDDVVEHPYFSFTVAAPKVEIDLADFEEKKLWFTISDIDNLAQYYMDKLEVFHYDIQGTILKLTTTGPVMEKELKFLKKLTHNYIYNKLNKRDEIAASKQEFIRNQLASVSDSLGKAEQNLEKFKRGSSAINLERTASNTIDQIQKLDSEVSQFNVNIQYYQSVINSLKYGSNYDNITAPSVVGINDPVLNENLVELKRLNTERAKAKFYKGKKSFDLKLLDEQIEATTKVLIKNLGDLVRSSRIALKDRQGRIAKLENKIKVLPKNEKDLINYERKSKVYENLYNYLSQELAKTEIARADDLSDSRILDEARMEGDGPVAPAKMLVMVLAMLVGLAIPLLWILIADSFENKIQTMAQIRQRTQLPVLAEIPRSAEKIFSIQNCNPPWAVAESFQALSASLYMKGLNKHKNIIGISSLIPDEGKTFTAINLAHSMAKGGKNVLLMDLDFRKEGILEQVEKSNALLEYVRGESAFPNRIVREHPIYPNLNFLSHQIPGQFTHELLSSNRFQAYLEAASLEYDFVILDTPSLGIVSDYLLTAKQVSVHLFVVRKKISRLSFLSDLEKLIHENDLTNTYLIFNDSFSRNQKYGYALNEKGQVKKKFWMVNQFK